jgi:Ca2+-binding RTX toxin-like protein
MVAVSSFTLGVAVADASPTTPTTTVMANEKTGLVRVLTTGHADSELTLIFELDDGSRILRVRDPAVELRAAPGCETHGFAVECTISTYRAAIELDLGSGDDTLTGISPGLRTRLRADLGPGDDRSLLGPGGTICGGYRCGVRGGKGNDLLVGTDTSGNWLKGGSGQDALIAIGSAVLSGGPGQDRSLGGPSTDFIGNRDGGDDLLDGRGGRDQMHDRGGADEIRGGSDDDFVYSPDGADPEDDTIIGGSGNDALIRYCGACRISLDGVSNDGERGEAERDGVDVENVDVENWTPDRQEPIGTGADRLIGSKGANFLAGTRGADLLAGLSGRDQMFAGGGNDVVRAADGKRDRRISCGPGHDRAVLDRFDKATGCEREILP